MKKNSESNLLMRYGSLFIGCALSLLIFSSAAAQYLSPPDDASQARAPKVTKFIYLPLILNKAVPGTPTTPPPGSTPTNTPTATATATNTQVPGQIVNGDFEQVNVGWTRYSKNGFLGLIGTADSLGSSEITPRVYPRSGSYMARLGGFNYEVNQIYQTVTLPNVTPLYLVFYYQIRGWSGGDCGYYGGVAKIYIGATKAYDHCIYHYMDTADWTKGAIDLTAIPGQTVQILFQMESAASGYWNYLYLDDIALAQTH